MLIVLFFHVGYFLIFSEQHTYTSSEHFHLEEGETMLARGNESSATLNETFTAIKYDGVLPRTP